MEKEKTQKKGTAVLKKVINTIINILIVLVLIVSVLIAVMSLTSKTNDGISVLFGHTIENIVTDSMKGGSEKYEGGNFEHGDVVVGKFTDYDFDMEYEVGDIVTYKGNIDDDTSTRENICHRIIEVADYQGSKCYRTMGDNNEFADQEEGDYASYIRSADIGSVFYSADYHGKVIKGLGNILTFLRTKFGFFICVLLPMIIFFMYELVRVVFNAAYYRKAKEDDDAESTEAEKKAEIDAAVAEALARKEEEAAADKTELTAEELEEFRRFQEFQKQQKSQQAAENNTDPPTEE